jgi:hypothetical protein
MKKTNLIALFTVTASLFIGNLAHAQYRPFHDYLMGDSNVKIKVKESNRFGFDGWRHIEKVKIKVDGETVYKSKIKVTANGTERKLIYKDGYAEADIGEAIRGFEIYNNGIDGDINVGGVYCDGIDGDIRAPLQFGGGFELSPDAVALSLRVAQISHVLSEYVSIDDQRTYLVPIKVQAGRCMATSEARGPYSARGSECLAALVAQIDFANNFVTQRLEIDATFDLAEELLAARETLAHWIE